MQAEVVSDPIRVAEARWWPACHLEELSSNKPLGLHIDGESMVLFRDASGTGRAVENRCPHRRAPLALGKITPEGEIRCGYHGWTFNGASGELSEIPNLDAGERLPQCTLRTYAMCQRDGLAYVWTGAPDSADADVIPSLSFTVNGHEFQGKGILPLSHGELVSALLDGPGFVVHYLGIGFVDKPLGNPQVRDGLLIIDRAAQWNWPGHRFLRLGPLHHRADYPLSLRTVTVPITGQTNIQLRTNEDRLLAEILVTPVPTTRGTTAIRWRARIDAKAHGRLSSLFGLLCQLNVSPFRLSTSIDGEKLASLAPGPAQTWRMISAPGNDRDSAASSQ